MRREQEHGEFLRRRRRRRRSQVKKSATMVMPVKKRTNRRGDVRAHSADGTKVRQGSYAELTRQNETLPGVNNSMKQGKVIGPNYRC